MTKFVHCVFIKHTGSHKKYLFNVDDMDRLKDGQTVLCDTRYGESEGICVGSSFSVSELALESICKGLDLDLPLKSVIGIIEEETIRRKVIRRFGGSGELNDLPF